MQRLERQRADAVGRAGEPPRANQRERPLRRHELRPVDQREPLLREEAHRLEAGARERVGAVEELALPPGLPLADERESQVRERREVPGGTDRATCRHERQNAAVQALEQQLDGLDACAGVPFRKRVGAQQHRRSHDRLGIGLADAARVRPEQSQLQLFGLLLRDRPGDEPPEARVHAVGVLVGPVRNRLDDGACRAHLAACTVGEHRRPLRSTAIAQTSSRERSSPVSACVAVTARV